MIIISEEEANKIIDKIVSNVIEKLKEVKHGLKFVLDPSNCADNNGKIVKNCAVYGYSINDKKILNRDFHITAPHSTMVAIVQENLDEYNIDNTIKMLLLSLLRQINKVEINYYDYRGLDKFQTIRKILLDLENRLSYLAWYRHTSKNTYPFDINNIIYEDVNGNFDLIFNTGEFLIDILVQTMTQYKIILVPINKNSNDSIFMDFISTDYWNDSVKHLDSVLKNLI